MKKKSEKPLYARELTVEELANRPDSAIDYSDIPELDAAFWKDVKISQPKTKLNVSLRLPEEVIAFFKAQNPKGYTGRMAAVLAAYVAARQGVDEQPSDPPSSKQ